MKPIVSFTLFGTDPKYYIGALRNWTEIKKWLPEWDMWVFFHPQMVLMDKISKLKDMGVVVKDVTSYDFENVDSFPYFWRFLAFFEDTPVIVRDLDSRISQRESDYIKNWLKSEKDYFVIRDHPWHAPIPSGLLGIKKRIIDFENHFRDFVKTQSLAWGADQEILRQFFYEKNNIESSSIFYCGYDQQDNYIARDDKNFFIGIQLDEFDSPSSHNAIHSLNYLKDLNL